MHYPRIEIGFCTKCKWNFRATWYLQELLSTFDGQLGEVALVPKTGGIFYVTIQTANSNEPVLLWDRKEQGRFPDSKELKRLVRDVIDPGRDLGHVDRHSKGDTPKDCVDCKDGA